MNEVKHAVETTTKTDDQKMTKDNGNARTRLRQLSVTVIVNNSQSTKVEEKK